MRLNFEKVLIWTLTLIFFAGVAWVFLPSEKKEIVVEYLKIKEDKK